MQTIFSTWNILKKTFLLVSLQHCEFVSFPQNLRVCLAHLVPPVHFHFGKGVFPLLHRRCKGQRSAFISQKRSQFLPCKRQKFHNLPFHPPHAPTLTTSPSWKLNLFVCKQNVNKQWRTTLWCMSEMAPSYKHERASWLRNRAELLFFFSNLFLSITVEEASRSVFATDASVPAGHQRGLPISEVIYKAEQRKKEKKKNFHLIHKVWQCLDLSYRWCNVSGRQQDEVDICHRVVWRGTISS